MATATRTPRLYGKGAKIPRQSREELTEGLSRARREKGEALTGNDFHKRRFDLMPPGHYTREFGSIKEALAIANTLVQPDPVLADVMEAAAEPAVPVAKVATPAWRSVRAIVTVAKDGVEASVQDDDVSNIIKLVRFVGDDTTADILNAWRLASEEMPAGPSYSYTARAGDVTISMQIV
jgi:hypothetical protein